MERRADSHWTVTYTNINMQYADIYHRYSLTPLPSEVAARVARTAPPDPLLLWLWVHWVIRISGTGLHLHAAVYGQRVLQLLLPHDPREP